MAVTNVVNFTGYSTTATGGSRGNGPADLDPQDEKDGFWPLAKCVTAYTTYLDSKRLEIEEQLIARRYRHGAQWNADQIKTFNDRKQPIVTYNKIGQKIDGIVGTVERLKQDPKAFPRTPEHQAGADLATAVLRYLMDNNNWNAVTPVVTESAAVDGLAGIELDLKAVPPTPQQARGSPPQEQPDYDVMFKPVDNDGFFYDPRSFKHDFEDARYLGMGKFVDEEQLVEMLPGMEEEIKAACDANTELMSNSDRDNRWFATNGDFKQIRLVDIWYKSQGGWKWALFTGSKILMQGESPFIDEHEKPIAKYIMFSAAVDHDGDRYGFPRNLMSPQDEVNQRRSKALHELNNRRIIATKSAIADSNVEALRREAARSDGIVLVNTSLDDIRFDDQAKQAAVMGQLQFMQDAKQEIETFGPNSAMIGGDAASGGSSGRAIALLQQAGLAGLGPYMFNLRGWKVRVYRALFNAAQKYWTNQRWIRITDAEGQPQFVQINEALNGPDGQPSGMMRNAIGELDVDIILDEGPDTITLMQDTYEAISQALPAVAPMLTPGQATAVMRVLIETSPLPADVKKTFRDAGEQEGQQPDPKQQEAQAKLLLQKQETEARMVLEAEKAKADNAHKQQAAMIDLEIERNRSANDIQIEREKAHAQMEVERFKAEQQAQLALAQAQIKAQQDQQQADLFENDVGLRTINGMILERDGVRRQQEQAKEQSKASKLDEALAQLVGAIGQSHQGLMQAMSKPRKAVIHRDPRTGKVIGAVAVSED